MTSEFKLVPDELLQRLISATRVARGEGSPTQRDAEAILNASQSPALGGEPEVIYQLKNNALKTDWRNAGKVAFDSAANLPEYSRRELVDRANVVPLLAEIKRLRNTLPNSTVELVDVTAERDTLKSDLTSANADKEAYAQNAIDLRKQVDALLAEIEQLKQKCSDELAKRLIGEVKIEAERDTLKARCEVLQSALAGMVEYFPEGRSDGECFSVDRAKAVLNQAAPAAKDGAQ